MAVTNYYSVNGQIIGEAANGVRTDYEKNWHVQWAGDIREIRVFK